MDNTVVVNANLTATEGHSAQAWSTQLLHQPVPTLTHHTAHCRVVRANEPVRPTAHAGQPPRWFKRPSRLQAPVEPEEDVGVWRSVFLRNFQRDEERNAGKRSDGHDVRTAVPTPLPHVHLMHTCSSCTHTPLVHIHLIHNCTSYTRVHLQLICTSSSQD
jgi:hypothetical protein